MQRKRSCLRAQTALTALVATGVVLWLTALAGDNATVIFLPWIAAPLLGLYTSRLWCTRSMLPPAAAAYTPDPLLTEGAFALSAVQFFPVPADYREDAPQPPARPARVGLQVLSWAVLALGWVGCLVPFFCMWASLIAFVLVQALGQAKDAPEPVRYRRQTALWLSLYGLWSGAMVVYISLQLTA